MGGLIPPDSVFASAQAIVCVWWHYHLAVNVPLESHIGDEDTLALSFSTSVTQFPWVMWEVDLMVIKIYLELNRVMGEMFGQETVHMTI